MQIIVNRYTKLIGGSEDKHDYYSQHIETSINNHLEKTDIQKVNVYDLSGRTHSHRAGRKGSELVIFINTTDDSAPSGRITYDGVLTFNGDDFIEYPDRLPTEDNPVSRIIGDDNDLPVAQWNPERYELNILFDPFDVKEMHSDFVGVFNYIIQKLSHLIASEKDHMFWNRTKNTDMIKNMIKQQAEKGLDGRIRDLKYKIENDTERVNNARRSIKAYVDNIAVYQRQLVTEENFSVDGVNRMLNDIELISKLPKVSDIQFDDKYIIIHTNELTIYADNGKMYYGGEYQIKIELDNSDIRIFGNNKQRGYWSDNDSHPHVSGRTGEPCWGNASSTIAELSSQRELYALVMYCIDYIESANTKDPAGEKVINWQEIDEDGNEIEREEIESIGICDRCGTTLYDGDDTYTVYESYDECNGAFNNEQTVCQTCNDEYYIYHDNIDTSVEEYYEHGNGNCDCEEEDEDLPF